MRSFLISVSDTCDRMPCFVMKGKNPVSLFQDGELVHDAFCVTNGPVDQFISEVFYPEGYGRGTGLSKIDPFYQACTNETSRGALTEVSSPIPVASHGGTEVHVSEDSTFSKYLCYPADVAITLIWNLIPHRRYYFRVVNASGETIHSGCFDTTGSCRQIRLNGVRNVRDMGGFKCEGGTIAYNKIWRGNRTDDATAADIAEFKRWGISGHLDLRSANGMYSGSNICQNYYGTVYNASKAITSDKYGISSYSDLLMSPGNLLNCIDAILTELESGGSIYFNCKNGADRTGSLAFILMGLLGCSENDMIMFWELTSTCGHLNTKRIHKQRYSEFKSGELRDMCIYLYKYYPADLLCEQVRLWFQAVVCGGSASKASGYIERLKACLVND